MRQRLLRPRPFSGIDIFGTLDAPVLHIRDNGSICNMNKNENT